MSARPRILFVDDEPLVLHALKRKLRERSHAWDMAFFASPVEALAAHRAAPFDIAVIDLRMPVMDGFGVIRELREVSADTVTIILTGTADFSAAVKAINEVAVFRFYPKPCAVNELTHGIEEALRHKAELARAEREEGTGPSPRSGSAGAVADSDGVEASMLDHLGIGAIIVDAHGRIVFTNRTGADLVAKGDGLVIDGAGVCRASTSADTERLHGLMHQTVGGDDTARGRPDAVLALSRRFSERPLTVVAYRRTMTDGRSGPEEPSAVLLVHDPAAREGPTEQDIASLLGLTKSEARLTKLLADGGTLEESSRRLGLTIESGRTYLKRIFQKTGAKRQADLVRMVLTSVPTK